MKKQLLAFAACAVILGAGAPGLSEAKAAHQTVFRMERFMVLWK